MQVPAHRPFPRTHRGSDPPGGPLLEALAAGSVTQKDIFLLRGLEAPGLQAWKEEPHGWVLVPRAGSWSQLGQHLTVCPSGKTLALLGLGFLS